jgi:hypothetical protein
MDVGDALLAAQARIAKGRWKKWLRETCFLSVRTAFLRMQLARNRDAIEEKIAQVGELNVRAAVRLLVKPKKSTEDTSDAEEPAEDVSESEVEKPDPVADAVAVLTALDDAQLKAVWTAFTLPRFLATISASMRTELVGRLMRLRPHTPGGESVLLRESEILRTAVSQLRIAATLNTAPRDIERAEAQALLALRMFTKATATLDIDRITITDVYAKEKRCNEKSRRAKKRRRAA